MDMSPEEFVDRIFAKEAEVKRSDDVKPDDLIMELPEWFDEKKYNQGRQFYHANIYGMFMSILFGIVITLAVPSILRVIMSTKHSNSVYTAYKRYSSSLLHFRDWFDNELKPGSISWKSIYAVRTGHIRASISSSSKGFGIVSQRDIALALHAAVCFSILKPDFFGIVQLKEGDWEGYNHFWRVIGHMLGLEDRYNVCRETVDETREVQRIILDRVYTTNLDNVPEYFEHTTDVLLDGMWSFNPMLDKDAILYWAKHLCNVPGYIYTENDRIDLQKKIKRQLNGKSTATGVESPLLIGKRPVNELGPQAPRILYYHDYETVQNSPEYRKLSLKSKFKLILIKVTLIINSFRLGRLYYNIYFHISLNVFKYFPFLSFFRFGIRNSFVSHLKPGPTDNTQPKLNAEYYL